MGRWRESWRRLRNHLRAEEVERGLADDVAFHLERQTAENLRRGMTPSEARREAHLAFGSIEAHKEAARDEVRLRWLEDLGKDLRFGLRMLARAPVFTAVAVASLALGIGADTAIFSVVHAVVLRPLPFPEPDRLVSPRIAEADGERASSLSAADFLALRDSVPAFSSLGVYVRLPGGAALTGDGEPRHVRATAATSGVFAALGVAPEIGRSLLPADDAVGSEPVVVLAHGFWRERFAGSPAALGRRIELDGESHTVVGVMPAGFHLPGLPDDRLWPILQLPAPDARAPFYLWPIARLAPGASAAQARAQLEAVAREVKSRYPGSPPGWSYRLEDLKETVVRDARPRLVALLAAVMLVLLLAVINVANLQLARATARAREFALRAALGAGRRRLVRQVLGESLLLVVAGGAAGLAVAWLAVPLLRGALPADVPRLDEVTIDGAVLAFTCGSTLAAALLVGLVPAFQTPAGRLEAAAREGERGGSDPRRGRLRAVLVVCEVAVALVVLIGAGLVIRSLGRLQAVAVGTGVDDALVARLTVPQARYPEEAQVAAFVDELQRRVASLPGVEAAGLGMAVPPNRLAMTNPFTPEGSPAAPGEEPPLAEELLITPGYLASLRIPVVAGRDFTPEDRAGAPLVALVNETLARRHFGGDALGRWLQTGQPDPDDEKLTIVGVVGDVKYDGPDAAPAPTIYVPYAQHLWWRNLYLVVAAPGDPHRQVGPLRARLAALDPQIPLQEVTTLRRLRREAVSQPRFQAFLFGSFGLVGLFLAAAGIYGLVAYTVHQRRRDFAIRLALGARRANVVGGVLAAGLRLAAAGVGLGLIGAVLAARLMRGLLFEVEAIDPLTFAAMAAFLVAVTLAACVSPASRAAATDPITALRAE
jgi:predicted permease